MWDDKAGGAGYHEDTEMDFFHDDCEWYTSLIYSPDVISGLCPPEFGSIFHEHHCEKLNANSMKLLILLFR